MSQQTIDNVDAKANEINHASRFIRELLRLARDPEWASNDPGYALMKNLVTTMADNIITLSNELKALIP